MTYFLSVLTSVKDYIDITHKLIESDPSFGVKDYTELGAVFTYILIGVKQFITEFISFSWLKNVWSLPIIVPDIASAMISEISVLDGYFHNAFTFLETPLSGDAGLALYNGNQNLLVYSLEKFMIGLINSFFLFLPTSTAHFITLRRFVMQGLEAGWIAGAGTIAGNLLWLTSIIFGWRFFIIPWLSFDIFRYFLGFCLLVKYIWDSSKERRMVLEDLSKWKIFLLNFLLALTEQSCIYPFISNISIGPEASILEGFPVNNYSAFILIHGCYLAGILIGSVSLLNFACWFWENPAFSIYMWMLSSYRVNTSYYYKYLNFALTYLTMLCGFFTIPYFGLDYAISNPLGFVPQDRLLDEKVVNPIFFGVKPGFSGREKVIPELSFLGVQPSDMNTRIESGLRAYPMRWRESVAKIEGFDASLYDQGTYNAFTLEDLNYGFDSTWFKRGKKAHVLRFKVLPRPWMLSVKKSLKRPTFKSEFYRLVLEQYNNPTFHQKSKIGTQSTKNNRLDNNLVVYGIPERLARLQKLSSKNLKLETRLGIALETPSKISLDNVDSNKWYTREIPSSQNVKDALIFKVKNGLINEFSALRKFSRNINSRIKTSEILLDLNKTYGVSYDTVDQMKYGIPYVDSKYSQPVYSKRWKYLFSKLSHEVLPQQKLRQINLFRKASRNVLMPQNAKKLNIGFDKNYVDAQKTWYYSTKPVSGSRNDSYEKTLIRQKLSKKERQILRYKSLLLWHIPSNVAPSTFKWDEVAKPLNTKDFSKLKTQTMLHPLKFYLQKEQAFRRKLKFYGTNINRKLAIGNNGPSFQAMMKRSFYYYKPTLRWKRTMYMASYKRGYRKTSRIPRKLSFVDPGGMVESNNSKTQNNISSMPTLKTSWQTSSYTTSNSGKNERSLPYASYAVDQMGANSAKPAIQKPTHTYSVLGKYPGRYRYEIYKDVLRHWYYTPFNRLIIKFDIDAFINRQPKTHFVTKKEERLLHLRRFLLAEHYDTLRWYTYMQHYRSMKNRIGGTKSFASRAYNQQFYGTFKKIRHLFAITPSQGEQTILKFDQPLYNEYPNNSKSSLIDQSVIHEELLSDYYGIGTLRPGLHKDNYATPWQTKEVLSTNGKLRTGFDEIQEELHHTNNKMLNNDVSQRDIPVSHSVPHIIMPEDLVEQSSKIVREYISETTSTREDKIKKLLNEQNYWELTQFLFTKYAKGGNSANNFMPLPNSNECKHFSACTNTIDGRYNFEKWLGFKFLRQFNKRYVGSKAMNGYLLETINSSLDMTAETVSTHTEKLQQLETWLNNYNGMPSIEEPFADKIIANLNKGSTLVTTGIQKALNDGSFVLNDINPYFSSKPFMKFETSKFKLKKTNKMELELVSQLKTEQQILTSLNKIQEVLTQSSTESSKKTPGSKKTANTESPKSILNIKPIYYLTNKSLSSIKTILKSIRYSVKGLMLDLIPSPGNSSSLPKTGDMWIKRYDLKKNQDLRGKKIFTTMNEIVVQANKSSQKTINSSLNTNSTSMYGSDFRPIMQSGMESSNNSSIRYKKDGYPYAVDQGTMQSGKSTIYQIQNQSDSKTDFQLFEKSFKKQYERSLPNEINYGKDKPKKRWPRWFTPKLSYGYPSAIMGAVPVNTYTTRRPSLFYNGYLSYSKESKQELEQFIKTGWIKSSNKVMNRRFNFIKSRWALDQRSRKMLTQVSFYNQCLNGYVDFYSVVSKMKLLREKLHFIQLSQEFPNWWWHFYLPRLLSSIPGQANITNPELKPLSSEQARQIVDKMLAQERLSFGEVSDLPSLEIMAESSISKPNVSGPIYGQAILTEPRETPLKVDGTYHPGFGSVPNTGLRNNGKAMEDSVQDRVPAVQDGIMAEPLYTTNVLNKIYENLFINKVSGNTDNFISQNINPLPFYAGWDESLRKFVVTNRLLSRRDAGFEMKNLNEFSNMEPLLNTSNSILNFNQFPIQGLSESLAILWEKDISSAAFNTDQFNLTTYCFYTPLGWRRFQFRHSILKTWFTMAKPLYTNLGVGHITDSGLNKNKAPSEPLLIKNQMPLQVYLKHKIWNNSDQNTNNKPLINGLFDTLRTKEKSSLYEVYQKQKFNKIRHRRIKKRSEHVKNPIFGTSYLPWGPLLTEVLPSHYLSVFDTQSRFPRDRYIKRRLRKAKAGISASVVEYTNSLIAGSITEPSAIPDFTLRKRVKPRFKYHRKRSVKRGKVVFPRRRVFVTDSSQEVGSTLNKMDRWRPFRKIKQTSSREKTTSTKRLKTPAYRLRAMRRRELEQVFKSTQRFKPRYGGFVWPGDYLRLETTNMPRLESVTDGSMQKTLTNKKRKLTPPVDNSSPVKYLLQKHNIKVLKKKLEKAQLNPNHLYMLKINSSNKM